MSTATSSINQLPITDEIVNGDYLIIDNDIETRRLNFKDFIIGLSNVTFASTISSNSNNIAALSGAIDVTTSDIATVSGNTDANSSDILSLSSQVTTNISALSSAISTNTTNISALSSTVNTNTTNISALSSTFFAQTPTVAVLAASTHYIKLRINGNNYALLLSATS